MKRLVLFALFSGSVFLTGCGAQLDCAAVTPGQTAKCDNRPQGTPVPTIDPANKLLVPTWSVEMYSNDTVWIPESGVAGNITVSTDHPEYITPSWLSDGPLLYLTTSANVPPKQVVHVTLSNGLGAGYTMNVQIDTPVSAMHPWFAGLGMAPKARGEIHIENGTATAASSSNSNVIAVTPQQPWLINAQSTGFATVSFTDGSTSSSVNIQVAPEP